MDDVFVGVSRFGKGAFAGRHFCKHEIVLEYRGRLYRREDNPKIISAEKNHFMQIGENLYLGPTRGPDTAANHSCDPNCGVVFENNRVWCVALRDIEQGEEITWDYSTTMLDDPWQMRCGCGAMQCRGIIREFIFLPSSVQRRYIEMGIVPPYVLDRVLPQITVMAAGSLARAASHSLPATSGQARTLRILAGS